MAAAAGGSGGCSATMWLRTCCCRVQVHLAHGAHQHAQKSALRAGWWGGAGVAVWRCAALLQHAHCSRARGIVYTLRIRACRSHLKAALEARHHAFNPCRLLRRPCFDGLLPLLRLLLGGLPEARQRVRSSCHRHPEGPMVLCTGGMVSLLRDGLRSCHFDINWAPGSVGQTTAGSARVVESLIGHCGNSALHIQLPRLTGIA